MNRIGIKIEIKLCQYPSLLKTFFLQCTNNFSLSNAVKMNVSPIYLQMFCYEYTSALWLISVQRCLSVIQRRSLRFSRSLSFRSHQGQENDVQSPADLISLHDQDRCHPAERVLRLHLLHHVDTPV